MESLAVILWLRTGVEAEISDRGYSVIRYVKFIIIILDGSSYARCRPIAPSVHPFLDSLIACPMTSRYSGN